jgi:hypothetical protein
VKHSTCFLFTALAAACLTVACPRPAAAYISILPPTLGDLCRQSTHIYVMKVDRFSAENGVILFKAGEPLKAEGVLPDGAHMKQVIGSNVLGAKIIFDWVAEGKTAVLFAKDFGLKSAAHVYIDGYWYFLSWNRDAKCWFATNGEPTMLVRYCGTPDKLGEVLPTILRGDEVVVPAMVSDNVKDVVERRARVQDVRVSLRILGNPKETIERNLKPEPDAKKPDKKPEPGDKKPAEGKKGEERKPDLGGTVKAIATDGKSFTLLGPPTGKNPEATVIDIRIGENAKIVDGDTLGKLAVGQTVYVWLDKGEVKTAMGIHIARPIEKKPAPDAPAKKPDDKKPEDTKPSEKKPLVRKPDRVGTVKALSADGKNFTLQPAPTEKNKEPELIAIALGPDTKITAGKEPGKLAVGQVVNVWLGKGENLAAEIQIGKLPEPPEKKPVDKKPQEKKPDVVGTVKALSTDGKRVTVMTAPAEKGKEFVAVDIQIGEGTKIIDGKEPGKLAVGQTVNVWLGKGDAKIATSIQISKPLEKKPVPEDTVKKPTPVARTKIEEPKKPKEPAKPPRDPAPTAAVIDTEIDKHLAASKIPISPQADDAEFLRRVTLDLTGRIPTYQQSVAFLDSKDPDKRRKLVDELLDSPAYGEHLGTIWRSLLVGRELNVNGKGGQNTDPFRAWLAEQFNDNRGWNAIVTDLLTAEGTSRENPATAFLMTNGENGRPQPNKVTGSVAAMFWGVNLRCAECHNHPFASWKQSDFWGTAAFFGKIQYGGGGKGGTPALAESSTVVASGGKEKGAPGAPMLRGTAIVIPATSGKAAGKVVKARFLGAEEPTLDENAPFRPTFAVWATAADNPYFARAAVNRTWAHFFGRGFVNPLDAFDTGAPSHPELLDQLTKEFTASGFDLKHLARCITTSKAYQRTSRPVPGNESDAVAFSHMAVKVLTPEVLYDALSVIGKESGPTTKTSGGKGDGGRQESREVFLRAFRVDDDVPPTEYIQGIPQLLRLMNTSSPNRGAGVVEKLYSAKASHAEAIATLYLTVLSRRPTAQEVELMSGYLSKRKDDREGFRGVLWILLNSSEFALNH